jgi:O-antigen/teichoic acid export membrane protein
VSTAVVSAASSVHGSVGGSVARGALALFSTQPLTWVASLLAAALVPRLLGADALGQYTAATSITAMGSTAAGLGISDYLIRRLAQRQDTLESDLGIALSIQLVAAVLVAVAIGILSPLLGFSIRDNGLLLVVLLGMVVGPAQTVLLSSFRGRERHAHYAWLNAIAYVLITIGGILVLAVGADVRAFAAAGVVLSVISTAIGWKISGVRLAFPALRRSTLPQVKEFIRAGFPFLGLSLTLSVYGSIDRVLLSGMVPASELGWYAAAYRIIGITVFIPSLLVTPLFPALSRCAGEPDVLRMTIAKMLRITLLLTLPMSAGIIVIAPVIPTLLGWPQDFVNAIPLMVILSLHLPIVAVDMVFAVLITAIGGESKWLRIGLVAVVFNIALNLLCIPTFEGLQGNGAIGASVVTVLTEVVMLCGALILIPKHLIGANLAWDATRAVVAASAIIVVGTLLGPLGLPFVVAGSALSYVAAVALLRLLTVQDIKELAGIVARRGR